MSAKKDSEHAADPMQVRMFHFELEGVTELLFGKPLRSVKAADEDNANFDKRVARERIGVNDAGQVVLPAVGLQRALVKAAQRRSEKIPGRGQSTFRARFSQGVSVFHDLVVSNGKKAELSIEDVPVKAIFVPLQPQSGVKSPRGFRHFPYLSQWSASGDIHVFDNLIDEERLARHFQECGMFCGLGSMNVGNGHNNGRFRLRELSLVE